MQAGTQYNYTMELAKPTQTVSTSARRASTFRIHDLSQMRRWCELTATVPLRPARHPMGPRYDVTYSARYSGRASECFYLHPLYPGEPTPEPSVTALLVARAGLEGARGCAVADTDGVIVPVNHATTALVELLIGDDTYVVSQAGRRLANLDPADKGVVEAAAGAYRGIAMRALAQFWD